MFGLSIALLSADPIFFAPFFQFGVTHLQVSPLGDLPENYFRNHTLPGSPVCTETRCHDTLDLRRLRTMTTLRNSNSQETWRVVHLLYCHQTTSHNPLLEECPNPPTIHSNHKWSHSRTWNNSNDGLAYTPSILTYPERCKKGDGSLCIWLLGIPWPKISQRLLHPWEYNQSLRYSPRFFVSAEYCSRRKYILRIGQIPVVYGMRSNTSQVGEQPSLTAKWNFMRLLHIPSVTSLDRKS